MIISASRRCDLPAFAFDSFLSSLEKGFVEVRNPFNAASIRRVSLLPDEVDCLVFWTRDPRVLSAKFDRLGPFRDRFFVHVTITGYPRGLEPGVLDTEAAAEALLELSSRIGRERVAWRYDPLIFAEGLGRDFHLANFERLATRLSSGVSRVVVSLLDEYAPTRRRLEAAGYANPIFGSPRPREGRAKGGRSPAKRDRPKSDALLFPEEEEAEIHAPGALAEVLGDLAAIAKSLGLPIGACAEPFDLSSLGIEARSCIDGAELASLFGFDPPSGRDRGQRPGCGCSPSVDIGEYGLCPAACVYCYARRG